MVREKLFDGVRNRQDIDLGVTVAEVSQGRFTTGFFLVYIVSIEPNQPMETSKLYASTDALLRRLEQDETFLSGSDLSFLQAADNLLDLVRRYRRIKEINPEGALGLRNNGYLGTPMKWVLKSQVVFIEEESIRLLWNGADVSKNASKYYKDDSLGLRRDSKLAVGEHPHPTSILKEQVFEEAPITSVVVFLRFILNRNVISWTAAIQDTRLREAGFNSNTPDRENVWARYEAVGIETFPLQPRFITKNGHDLKVKALLKVSATMRQEGCTFEEFKSAITY